MAPSRRPAIHLLTFLALSGLVLAAASASSPPTAKVESLLYLPSSDVPAPSAPSDGTNDALSNASDAIAPPRCTGSVNNDAAATAGYAGQRGGGFVAPRPHAVPPDRVVAGPHGAPQQQSRDVIQDCDAQSGAREAPLQANLSGDDGEGIEGKAVGAGGSKSIVGLTALGSYVAVTLAAKFGILPGPLGGGPDGSSLLPYADSLILRDLGASLLCAALGLGFVKAVSALAASDVLESRDSRKIIHTLSAPLFVTLWPVFSDAVGARYFSGIVPLTNAVRLYVAATGSGDEEELAGAVSRSGDAKEAIGGPFFYVLVLLAATVGSWRDDLVGIVAVSTMAAGDGLADLIGRRYGKTNKWFFNKDKSVAGSAAFFAGASLCSVALAWWLGQSGALTLPLEFADLATRIVLISALCAAVELVPVVDDNWSVPLSAAALSALLLH